MPFGCLECKHSENSNVNEGLEKLEPSCFAFNKVDGAASLGNSLADLKKLNQFLQMEED